MRIGSRMIARSAVVLLIAAGLAPPALAEVEGEPRPLFNGKDLSGWRIYVDPDPNPYSPESRPERVFRVQDGSIRVSGERHGCLSTLEEFDNYRLVVEFRWGERRWPPRAMEKRDSGILVHASGPDMIWTRSIECQIQEGDCGDFWLVGGTTLVVDGELQANSRAKTEDAEKPHGEWNTVEVICDGGEITNIVNGRVVNRGTEASDTRGRIILQSEGAEVFYRKVDLHPLP